ncbi:MAG: UDP-N-acetylglucosamine 4,6-dehydratase [uncultured Acidimicrobiales bacterium]|uniref:UDP-N-acetylglucosamine 4,6-dehydratase n=1 Tax=uncultured Acidimicrobiales bacterium TaxID=310071 RepID=A0A6J4HJV6_9ACTN|nr:MAG: UDP-N-acetylglucosamine 4,6-dehydratase [uncultured Acidimicrobiales bacterium]
MKFYRSGASWGRAVAGWVVDGVIWSLALMLATLARLLDVGGDPSFASTWPLILLAIAVQVGVGLVTGLYRGRWRLASFDEIGALAQTVAITTGVLFVFDVAMSAQPAPRSAVLSAGFITLVGSAGARYLWRRSHERGRRPSESGSVPVLVFGAGEGGGQVITAMLRDPASPYYPVGLLDDDPSKRFLRIMGVPVVGNRDALARAADRLDAQAILIAIPSADARLISDLSIRAEEAGLEVKVLPSVRDLLGSPAGIDDIRDVDLDDLLGRHRVETDVAAIAGYLTGRRVLVTGAGGSIGSQLCCQISQYGPAKLVMVDRDESGLHATQLMIEGRALLDDDNLELADIRDVERLNAIFTKHRPEVVFHAAALKHLTFLEREPGEAVKTNVMGTISVLSAAAEAGVEQFVNISTDKAADPSSVLGYSKRIGERVTAHFGGSRGGSYLSVRFGNVLGSRGSVLITFKAQLEAGEPLTVTHPDVTRYFMTVEEAVELVIQAGAIGRSGEALVLDMGKPVRISDVAHRLAASYEAPGGVVYTGLRPGEKLHEVLLGTDEVDSRPFHPLISHVTVPPLDPIDAMAIDPWDAPELVVKEICEVCYQHPNDGLAVDLDLTTMQEHQEIGSAS